MFVIDNFIDELSIFYYYLKLLIVLTYMSQFSLLFVDNNKKLIILGVNIVFGDRGAKCSSPTINHGVVVFVVRNIKKEI